MPKNVKNFNESKSVAELKKEVAQLKRENNAAYKTIDKLIKEKKKKYPI